MSDEWQGWLHEFPSREAVEAHVAASPPLPWASAWATGAPWMRVAVVALRAAFLGSSRKHARDVTVDVRTCPTLDFRRIQ